jgi:predicted Rossmann-fold nucleotide-binding protein
MESLCLFCGSNFGALPAYRESAVRVGTLLADRGITLIYGGGNVGLMGVLADACLAAGGKACAVLNVEGFYDSFLAQADRAVKDGFVSVAHRGLVIAGSDPGDVLSQLERYQVPQVEKWYSRPVPSMTDRGELLIDRS